MKNEIEKHLFKIIEKCKKAADVSNDKIFRFAGIDSSPAPSKSVEKHRVKVGKICNDHLAITHTRHVLI